MTTPIPAPRVALVHDFLLDLRGAERVFLRLCDLFPDADVYTTVYDELGTQGRFAHRSPHTSFLQRLRPTSRTFRALLPLFPHAIESLDLRGYDLVISSSSAWAHGAIADEHAVHVCYCHNTFRYAWTAREETLAARRGPLRAALRLTLSRWRQWDASVARRVDLYVANSRTTQLRLRRYLGRESDVLHPPVETERFSPGPVGEHYAVLSELMPHKRIDVAIEAFNRLGLPLVVMGDGPAERRLRKLAGPTIRFAGPVSDAKVAMELASARALVVTAQEEFGIAAVEAQAAGRPVIAFRAGGAIETVSEGATGVFYDSNEPAALAEVVRRFDPFAIDSAACTENAARFDAARFDERLSQIVAQSLGHRERHQSAAYSYRPATLRRGLARRP